jgi:hypothetical protein
MGGAVNGQSVANGVTRIRTTVDPSENEYTGPTLVAGVIGSVLVAAENAPASTSAYFCIKY